MRRQIGSNNTHPTRVLLEYRGRTQGRVELGRDVPRQQLDLVCPQWQPMVRHRSRDRRRAFCHVEATHGAFVGTPATHELARMAHARRAAPEQVRVQRQHDLSAFESILRVDRPSERQRRSGTSPLGHGRLVLMPACFRKLPEERAHLCRERRRRHGLGQQPQTGAISPSLRGEHGAQRVQEGTPGTDLTRVRHHLRSIRVVHRQNRCLRVDVGRAETGRMLRISFDFGRPPHVALDQEPRRPTSERHGGCEKQRLAGYEILGRLRVRHDGFFGLARARPKPSERHRRAHQLQKTTAIERPVERRCLARKLACQKGLKFGRLCQFFQATPIDTSLLFLEARAHRGQARLPRAIDDRHCSPLDFRSRTPARARRPDSPDRQGPTSMLKISSRGRTWRSGLRWQSRHHSICNEASCHTRFISSIRP